MAQWFTSDTHFGHAAVAGYRGYENSDLHDDAIFSVLLSYLHPDDDLWVLGDLEMGGKLDAALGFIKRLPGRKHLIAGNHDSCHPMHRKAHRMQRQYFEAFESVQAFAKRRINGQEVLLSHFPYSGDHTAMQRHTQWRLRDEGGWLLHGHTHSELKGSGRQIHVGLDAWGLQPVSEGEIAKLMKERDQDLNLPDVA